MRRADFIRWRLADTYWRMKQLAALLRTTWWLWLLFFGISIGAAMALDPVFWILLPMCVFTMLYFAYIRFDEHGNRK